MAWVDIVSDGPHAEPPGSGRMLLARVLPSILPRQDFEEVLDVTRVYLEADKQPAI
jgi:predicted ATPase with chaperone activity